MALETIPTAARILGLHPAHLLRLIRKGRIPAYRFNVHYRVDVEEVKRLSKTPPRQSDDKRQ